MSVESTPLSDGGRVDASYAGYGATIYLQKYDAAGAPLGSQQTAPATGAFRIEPLSNGGYLFVGTYDPTYAPGSLSGAVFAPDGSGLRTLNTYGHFDIEASPLGGFTITAQQVLGGHPPAYVPPNDSTVTFYDNAGAVVSDAHVFAQGRVPDLTVDASGVFGVAWSDGLHNETLAIDPRNPPTFTPPSVTVLYGIDDMGPVSNFTSGAAINDQTPTFKVAVSETGYLGYDIGHYGGTKSFSIPVTAEDVARGYVLVPTGRLVDDGTYYFFTRMEDSEGVTGPESRLSFSLDAHIPDVALTSVTDDAGPVQGELANGARTDDATPTIKVTLGYNPQPGDTLVVENAGVAIAGASHTITADEVAQKYALVTPTLTAATGDVAYHLTIRASDPAGNVSISNNFDLTLAGTGGGGATSGQVYTSPGPQSMVSGGDGNDTLVASAGGDTLVGGSGDDVFRLSTEPWAPIHVTDFAVGHDRLDLSALFAKSGYTGTDPVRDGYIVLASDGAGGAIVRFDRDASGSNPQWPNTIVDLEHVPTAGLTWAQISGSGGTTSPPPPPPPPPPSDGGTTGQVYTSPAPGSAETGGAGNDTFYASQGSDTLTGGTGKDVFVLQSEPWAPIHITDFTVGDDKLDLSALFAKSGYSGSDPVADGYVVLASDGAGGTIVRFDRDAGGGSPQWPNTIVDLEHVTGVSWSQIAGTAPASGGGSTGGGSTGGTAGQVYTSPSPGSVETGDAGNDTFYASQGNDTLTGAAGADRFVFQSEPWAPIHITDFAPGSDKIDVSALLAKSGYTGSDPFRDGYLYLESDGAGGTLVRFDRDAGGPTPQWPNTIIDVEHVAPSQFGPGDWILH